MKLKAITFFSLCLINHVASAQIKLVLGTALTDSFCDVRKAQYLESFRILSSLGYNNFYVIEGFKRQGPTFLEDHCDNVFYASVQNPGLRNNGVNEARTLLEGCNYFNFSPEDMVIKMTGRYHWISNHFLRLVEDNPHIDAFIKINENNDTWTVAFAMRYKYLKEMYSKIDYNWLENAGISIESEVKKYILTKEKQGNFKVMFVDKLDLKAVMYGSSTNQHWNSGNPSQQILIF
jgi:hypothetical protein